MPSLISFTGALPSARYDGEPWTQARVDESTTPSGPWTAIETVTLTPIDTDPAAPQARNITSSQATLSEGWYRLVFLDADAHEQATDPVHSSGSDGSLVTRGDLLTFAGKAASPKSNAVADLIIPAASNAVRSYADRSWGLPVATETRTFRYDGSGYLDIDDASVLTDVTVAGYPSGASDTTLTTDEWLPGYGPFRAIVEYVELLEGWTMGSPEMGFTRNLDTYYRDYRGFASPQVKVTGTWGWTTVPDDVKLAVLWVAAAMTEAPGPVISESIEGYSRSVTNTIVTGVPDRAKELLAPWVRQIT